MHRYLFAGLIIFLALCDGLVLSSSRFLSLASSNSSSNDDGTLSDVPDGFEVRGIRSDQPQPQLDQIGVYQTAVTAMEDLAFMNQEATLPSRPFRSWSMRQYDVRIDIRSTRVRWAVYGLLTGVALVNDARIAFQPVLVYFFWHDHEEGLIKFMRRDGPFARRAINRPGESDVPSHLEPSLNMSAHGVDGAAADALDTLLYIADPDSSTPGSNSSHLRVTPLSRPQLQVVPTYNGGPMTSETVFVAALGAMVAGAEHGPGEPCPRITGDTLKIVPIFDAGGQSVMKYRSLIRAMRILTRWMAANQRFGEIDFEVKRDGAIIGTGRLKNANSEVARL